jgi:nucleotide-binding universal stress UspA family protein
MQAVESKIQIGLKNILFATDFSASSSAALPYATWLARRFGARLHLAHIAPGEPFPLVPPAEYIPVSMRTPLSQCDALRQTEKQLAELAQSPQFAGLRFEAVVGEGDAATELADMVEVRAIDLVVLGTHGYQGLDRLLLGSVAEQLLRTLPCPVLTAGPKVWVKHPEAIAIEKIVLATDLSAAGERAARYAVSLAQETGAQLVLLHVVKLDERAFSFDRAMAEAGCRQRLLEAFPECGKELWCKPMIAFGEPAEQIVKTAREQNADLIVMGAHLAAVTGVATHLGGGAAHKVLLEAPCPVLSVRH